MTLGSSYNGQVCPLSDVLNHRRLAMDNAMTANQAYTFNMATDVATNEAVGISLDDVVHDSSSTRLPQRLHCSPLVGRTALDVRKYRP